MYRTVRVRPAEEVNFEHNFEDQFEDIDLDEYEYEEEYEEEKNDEINEFEANDDEEIDRVFSAQDIHDQEYKENSKTTQKAGQAKSSFMVFNNVKQVCHQVSELANSVDLLVDALDTVVPVVQKASESFIKMTSFQTANTESDNTAHAGQDDSNTYYSFEDGPNSTESDDNLNYQEDEADNTNSQAKEKTAPPNFSSKADLMKMLQNPLVQNILSNLNKKNA